MKYKCEVQTHSLRNDETIDFLFCSICLRYVSTEHYFLHAITISNIFLYYFQFFSHFYVDINPD